MIPLLTLSFAHAELLIQTNLQENYIEGLAIYVDILIQNIGTTIESLPNLKMQTSKIMVL